MRKTVKPQCDRSAIGRAIRALNLPDPATTIGLYMVEMLGYTHAITIQLLKKGLGMDESMIEKCLDMLIRHDVVRRQPMASTGVSFVIDATFGNPKKNACGKNGKVLRDCDSKAVISAIRSLELPEPVTVVGEYMVKNLGYRYAILTAQLKKGLAMPESLVEKSIEDLVAHGVVRKQLAFDPERSYVVNPAFGVEPVGGEV